MEEEQEQIAESRQQGSLLLKLLRPLPGSLIKL